MQHEFKLTRVQVKFLAAHFDPAFNVVLSLTGVEGAGHKATITVEDIEHCREYQASDLLMHVEVLRADLTRRVLGLAPSAKRVPSAQHPGRAHLRAH